MKHPVTATAEELTNRHEVNSGGAVDKHGGTVNKETRILSRNDRGCVTASAALLKYE
jgi:hypothetical protein